MTRNFVYADYNATTPVRPEARRAIETAAGAVGNPSSVHAYGRRAKGLLDDARDCVGAVIGAKPSDVIFTSGATEANNLAITGAVRASSAGVLFVSSLEHDSVWRPAHECGAPIHEIPALSDGCIDLDWLRSRLSAWNAGADGAPLVCLMLANNETGVVQPVQAAADIAHRAGGFLLCDAVQALGRRRLDLETLGADYLTLSAHKAGGLAGSGALVVRGSSPFATTWFGGGQERGRRPGSENLIGAVSFGAVCEVLNASDFEPETQRVAEIRNAFENALSISEPNARIAGRDATRLFNTSCVIVPNASAELAVMALDLAGVACSAGAACSSGKIQPSRALRGMGLSESDAKSAVRFSFGWDSKPNDGVECAKAFAAVTRRLREQQAA